MLSLDILLQRSYGEAKEAHQESEVSTKVVIPTRRDDFPGGHHTALVNMRYEDHELLLLKDVSEEPYHSLPIVLGAPIQRIPHPWAQGLDTSGLLGLINMPHFGILDE